MLHLLVLFAPAFAATWTVDPAGGDFASIQDGVDGAAEGDELVIAAGVYVEDVVLGGKSLTLTGAGSGSTVIAGTTTTIDAVGSSWFVLTGLSIEGGARGVDMDGTGTLTDVNVYSVGAGHADGSVVRLEGGELAWTSGEVTDADSVLGGIYANSAIISLDGIAFAGCTAESGAGVYAVGSEVTITGGSFTANSATDFGGAVGLNGGSLVTSGVSFVSNTASTGGALYLELADVTSDADTFTSNSASEGGAIWITGGSLLTDGETFDTNSGGAVAAEDAELIFSGATFEANITTANGGSLRVQGGSLVVSGSTFADNQGPRLVDLYVAYSDTTIRDTTFTNPINTSGSLYVTALSVYVAGMSKLTVSSVSVPESTYSPGFYAVGIDTMEVDSVTTATGTVSPYRKDFLAEDVGSLSVTGNFDGNGLVNLEADSCTGSELVVSGGATLFLWTSSGGTVDGVDSTDSTVALFSTGSDLSVSDIRAVGGEINLLGNVSLTDATLSAEATVVGYTHTSDVLTLSDISITEVAGTAVTLTGAGAVNLTDAHIEGATSGAISMEDGELNISSSWFGGNSATAGGALYAEAGTVNIDSSVFFGNEADQGGALWLGDVASSIEGSIFVENTADEGGAVYLDGGTSDITQVTAVGNESTLGASLHLDGSYATIVNVIVAQDGIGTGLETDTAVSAASSLRYDDTWGNAAGEYGGSFVDPTGSHGDISADSLFVAYSNDGDLSNDDLRLQVGSPCIDAGYPTWYDPDGSRSDIGAFGGTYAASIDFDGDGLLESEGDCDNSDADVNPDSAESCNGVDDDCDGVTDPDSAIDASTWFADTDGDGFGDASDYTTACSAPSGYVADNTDCDISDAAVNPAAAETCDGVDNDCDGLIDPGTTWFADTDGDGYGDAASIATACIAPLGYVADPTDCDDNAAAVFPGSPEILDDGIDQDCDGADEIGTDTGTDTGTETGIETAGGPGAGDSDSPAAERSCGGGCQTGGATPGVVGVVAVALLLRRRKALA